MAETDVVIASLRLINTPGIGAGKFYRLVDEHGSAAAAVRYVEKNGKYQPWSLAQAQQEVAEAAEKNIHILLYHDIDYPAMLKNLPSAPPVLYVKGRLDALNYGKSLAIVGGRNASVIGRKTAARFAFDLTNQGIRIISGMARGIDAAAAKGAMYALHETGMTVAVLGTGADVPYPPENTELYERICTQGCVLSEMPLGTQANPQHFPRRNRIIAGLSEGTLVIEAGLKSGSLITAQLTLEQKKMLFAVPGTPGESRTQGANMLIKKGAVLAENAADILPFLKGNKSVPVPKKEMPQQKILVFENNNVTFSNRNDEPENLVDLLTTGGTDIDELIRLTGKTAAELAMEILELEMQGIIERRPGNKIARVK